MPMLNSMAQVLEKPFPRMITPKSHAIADYINVGVFLMAAGVFWRRTKRASLAALVAGGTGLVLNLLTDYPGGVKRVINFRAHREIDYGMAAMVSSLPKFFAFKDEQERKFFLAEGAFISGITELTRVPREEQTQHKRASVA